MEFNPKDYVCKFYFMKYDHAGTSDYRQKVSADLYLKELKIEIFDSDDKVVDIYGYPLDNKMEILLSLLEWDKFEKNRDISGWDLKSDWNCRDGWGYEFLCINESGNSLIRNWIDVTFKEKDKPAYERLFDWIIREYAQKKELKKYKLVW